jgi:hypothetical protein
MIWVPVMYMLVLIICVNFRLDHISIILFFPSDISHIHILSYSLTTTERVHKIWAKVECGAQNNSRVGDIT